MRNGLVGMPGTDSKTEAAQGFMTSLGSRGSQAPAMQVVGNHSRWLCDATDPPRPMNLPEIMLQHQSSKN